MDRKILHVDMNSFYASVELITRPELKDKPVIVGGDESKRHGIVLAKNEVAKKYGIKTAETIYQARNKCPHLIVLPAHHDLYTKYSLAARKIYLSYTDRMEPFGPDEAWLDLSKRKEPALDLAKEIKARVYAELGLTVSIGVSWNKIFAKMGSDYKKPNAITVISRDNYKELLWPLDVSEFFFVGEATAKKLHSIGINTIGDLAKQDPQLMQNYLGKNGSALVYNARGQNNSKVLTPEERGRAKSIGSMRTTSQNISDELEIKGLFKDLAAEVYSRMAADNLRCNTVRIYVRDAEFRTYSRQKTLAYPIYKAEDILEVALDLYEENFSDLGAVRLLGITAEKLEDKDASRQLNFLDLMQAEKLEAETKDPQLEKLIKHLQEQFGEDSIFLAKDLEDDE